MTRMLSLVTLALGAALALAMPAGSQIQPDVVERAVAARDSAATTLTPSADAFERATAMGPAAPHTPSDAFERAVALGPQDALPQRFPSDAFERMLQNRSGWIAAPVLTDHNARMSPTEPSSPPPVTSSGSTIAWPEIGIGFGLGVLLALGLVLGVRVAGARPLAH